MNRVAARLVCVVSLLSSLGACGGATPEAGVAAASDKPSDAYLAYVTAIGNADKIKELEPFLTKAAASRAGGDLEALKSKVPGGRLVFRGEHVEGTQATLTVKGNIQSPSGKEVSSIGTVSMVREGGHWKVDQEKWQAEHPTTP